MKIAVISDLHIGHSVHTHQLGHTDKAFSKFLSKLEEKYDKIILLGDILEIEMERILDEHEVYKYCLKNHETVTKHFENNKYIHIFGNHDLIAEKYGAQEKYELEYKDKKYLFIHGHQFDYFYKATKKSLVFWGSMCLKISPILYKWISEGFELGNVFSIKTENQRFQDRAIDYAYNNKFDVIITGHTHDPKVLDDDVLFINSGTCSHGRICYVHMDLDKQKFEIRNNL